MLRNVVLGVAHRGPVRSLATGRIGWQVARRFVAGRTIAAALDVIRELNAAGMDASIDYLGENVTDLAKAAAARDTYLSALDFIERERLQANVSVKITAMGLDVDAGAAFDNTAAIVERAARAGTSVTLDMEDHRYTDRTIDMCVRLAETHPGHVGVAVQAYLRRTPEDLERLIAAKVHVRLCKGAYREPSSIAFRSRGAVDAAFARLATRLLESESYAMIATHDEALIAHAAGEVRRLGREPGTYEYQMLHGVRRELQRRLVDQGERLRIYLPFGEEWYPYLTRRIAERPANMRFFVEALVRG